MVSVTLRSDVISVITELRPKSMKASVTPPKKNRTIGSAAPWATASIIAKIIIKISRGPANRNCVQTTKNEHLIASAMAMPEYHSKSLSWQSFIQTCSKIYLNKDRNYDCFLRKKTLDTLYCSPEGSGCDTNELKAAALERRAVMGEVPVIQVGGGGGNWGGEQGEPPKQ